MQSAFKGFAVRKIHGGETRIGKRKEARPIATKKRMHLTLRSSRATGKLSLFTRRKEIQSILLAFGKRFDVRVFEQSNNGNHLHLVVQARTRGGFKRFLMAISGRIAQLMTRARKSTPLLGRFWDHLPFTRILEWGNDLRNALKYVEMNQLEAAGVIPYRPRRRVSSNPTRGRSGVRHRRPEPTAKEFSE